MPLLSADQHAAVRAALVKTDASTDTVTYAQILALADAGGLQTNKQGDAVVELLGGGSLVDAPNQTTKTVTVKHLMQRDGRIVLRKSSKGWLVEGFQLTPTAQARLSQLADGVLPVEPVEMDTGIAPYVPVRLTADAVRGAPAALAPMGRLPRMEDFDTKTASTSLTAGARLESVRRQMGAPASSADEKIARLEATQEKLLDAVEKINETLRKYRDTFNSHVDILDVTQEAVAVLQHNVGVLHHDITGLYGA